MALAVVNFSRFPTKCRQHSGFVVETLFTNMSTKVVSMQFEGILLCSTIRSTVTVTCSTLDGTTTSP